MMRQNQSETLSEAVLSQKGFSQADERKLDENHIPPIDEPSSINDSSWREDITQTVQLGEQLIGFFSDVLDMARLEALLAVRTLPKLVMLWLLMMPIMLLTWCAFSALMSWSVMAASNEIGLGMLTFFLLQVLLLLVCRWLFVRYRARMTFSHTREQIDSFIRSTRHEVNRQDKTKA